MKIEYNVETEVSKSQWEKLKYECAGVIAHRVENGKYYILLWLSRHKKYVERILNTTA